MLQVRGISKSFGGVQAVNDVSFSVGANEIHGLIGPNGAGKTTLINLISGLLSVTSGKIMVGGESIETLPAEKRAHKGVARTFQNLRLFRNLSVRRNIEVADIQVRGRANTDPGLIEDAIDRFNLRDVLDQVPDSLPYGQMRRLEIVRALALRPRVLMLDEPAAGMNPAETDELFRNITWLRTRHPCAIVLIDHDLKFIMSACERLTVMNMGSLLASGLPQDVTKNKEVISAYLGQGENV
ncbi:MAG: ABC transporter ATP-binding protein [Albidovulum sp.]